MRQDGQGESDCRTKENDRPVDCEIRPDSNVDKSGSRNRQDIFATIYQLAGAVGVIPDTLTLRELVWLADGKRSESWSRLSTLMALIANFSFGNKKKWQPKDFNLFEQSKKKGKHASKADLMFAKMMFEGLKNGSK